MLLLLLLLILLLLLLLLMLLVLLLRNSKVILGLFSHEPVLEVVVLHGRQQLENARDGRSLALVDQTVPLPQVALGSGEDGQSALIGTTREGGEVVSVSQAVVGHGHGDKVDGEVQVLGGGGGDSGAGKKQKTPYFSALGNKVANELTASSDWNLQTPPAMVMASSTVQDMSTW